jgi:hypothetical protein
VEHGVVFEKKGIIDNNLMSWYQTFVVPLTNRNFKDREFSDMA